jgi:hypothetical protein
MMIMHGRLIRVRRGVLVCMLFMLGHSRVPYVVPRPSPGGGGKTHIL